MHGKLRQQCNFSDGTLKVSHTKSSVIRLPLHVPYICFTKLYIVLYYLYFDLTGSDNENFQLKMRKHGTSKFTFFTIPPHPQKNVRFVFSPFSRTEMIMRYIMLV